MKKKAFENELTEIIESGLEQFKAVSPDRQQKFLAWLDRHAAEQKHEFERNFLLRLKMFFAGFAHKTEVSK